MFKEKNASRRSTSLRIKQFLSSLLIIITIKSSDNLLFSRLSFQVSQPNLLIGLNVWYYTIISMKIISKERNNRLFNGKECLIIQVVYKIKSLTLRWLKAKFSTLPFNYHGWWLNPFTILDIG